MRHIKFTVSGRGLFPLDMLRYDCCYPASPQDVNSMDGRARREVTLVAANPVAPTTGRWASFGWDVIKEEVLR
jgi:hypothetical protein